MMIESPVLVTGATGALGPVLVERLLQARQRVRVFTRRPLRDDFFSRPVEVIAGELGDAHRVAEAMAGVDLVFHLAARLHTPNPPPSLYAEYERVNVAGTHAVFDAAQQAGVRRAVYFSTIAVYGSTPGVRADETTPPRPDSIYATTKLAAEAIALPARQRDSGQPIGCVLRMAAVYGARMKGNYHQLALALARGWFVPIGEGLNRRTLIHENDAVSAALLVASHPNAPGQVFNVTDGETPALRDILAAICLGLGRRPPVFHLPLSWARSGARVVDGLLGLAGRNHRPAQARLDKYLEEVAVSGQKFQRELGFAPQYDLQSGWRQTIAEMKQTGQL